jgi:CBS domain-containing protein
MAMRNLLCKWCTGIGGALLPPAALATQEEVLATIWQVSEIAFVFVVIVIIVAVYFMKSQDKRGTPLGSIFKEGAPIHAVGPATPVTVCVQKMTVEKIGAVIVMDADRLIGIFTERDALNKVLAAGRDPVSTQVSEVMTRDPYCIPPTMTVGEAMEMVTARRIRHLPVVENGRVLAVLSSGDLTHWLVKDQMEEV